MRYFHLLLLLAVSLHADPPEELEQSLERFVEVFNLVDKNLADPIDPEDAIYRGALPAMVRTLDPHSAFLDQEQFESLQEMQRSTEKRFGSVLSLFPGRVVVLQTLPGSPSERSGLTAGDEIVAVNGYDVGNLTLALAQGTTLTGSIAIEATQRQPAGLTRVRITANALQAAPLLGNPEGRVDDDGWVWECAFGKFDTPVLGL